MTRNKITSDDVRNAVVSLYLKTGEPVSIAEIAKHLECGAPRVRSLMSEAHGVISGLDISQAERESYSKDYPMMQVGYHRVYVYSPSKSTLRALVLAATESTAQEVAAG